MGITLSTPAVGGLGQLLSVLRSWQVPGAPVQLHPGDVGWFWRAGPEATAAALRRWTAGGETLAVGLLDGPELLRLAVRPDRLQDPMLAAQLVADVDDPSRQVLPAGEVAVETATGALVHDLLGEHGWGEDEPWAILRRDLAAPVETTPGPTRVEVVTAATATDWVEVHHGAFGIGALVTAQQALSRWHRLAAGAAFADARCLLARDDQGRPVAEIVVWSAGPGRDGVIEPMGVHPDHRGRGFGRVIVRAGAAALRDLGATGALVATTCANTAGVATYAAAGFVRLPDRRDRCRR